MDGILCERPLAPRISVIVLGYRTLGLLESCLSALARQTTTHPYEVTVVLNGAAPEVVTFVNERVRGATVVRSPHNLGFAGGCNLGVAASAGLDYFVFLNDDAVPDPDWLEALVAFADNYARAGAVGSLVLFPDGTVQEAGGVVWQEGTTALFGRGQRYDHPDVSYPRRVDYASACALLVRRAAWEEVGGFDAGFFPAYYEDVDLCLALRERGWHVWYTPTAQVVHTESASTGRAKAVMFRAAESRFKNKWRALLTDHIACGEDSRKYLPAAVIRARASRRRVLVIDDRAPTAGMGAGFDRMLTVLQALLRHNTQVAFHPSNDGAHSADLSRMGVETVDDIDRFVGDRHVYLDAIVASRPNNLGLALRARDSKPSAAVVYDAEALFFRRHERWAALTQDPDDRQAALRQAADLLQVESSIARHVDAVVTISQEEREWFQSHSGSCPVLLVPPFPEQPVFTPAGFVERRGAIFVAGWAAGPASPNAHGLHWFVKSVLPRVRAALPWVSVRVTGGNPPDQVRQLRSAAVSFLGHVDDLSGLYGDTRVAISPILWGAGVKLKTVEALAHGVPVVSTPIGAEGIPDRWREQVDIAIDDIEFADRLVTMLTDRAAWDLRRTGIAGLHADHCFDLGRAWLEIIGRAAAHRLQTASA